MRLCISVLLKAVLRHMHDITHKSSIAITWRQHTHMLTPK